MRAQVSAGRSSFPGSNRRVPGAPKAQVTGPGPGNDRPYFRCGVGLRKDEGWFQLRVNLGPTRLWVKARADLPL